MRPSSEDDVFNRWMKVQLDVLLPLGRRRNLGELIETAENILKDEADPVFRQLFMGGVSAVLHTNGWEDESLTWCRRAIAEFPEDPIVYNALAMRSFANPLREPTQEDLDKALEHSAVAVEKARSSNTWRRYVLHDRCRIAVAAKRYDIVTEAMAEILEVWVSPCEPDIPIFESDWLGTIPENAIEPDLLRRYLTVTG